MATSSSLGIGTGIDLNTMLTSIINAERAPITALDTKISAANNKISLYGTLKSKLDALQTAADTLQYPSRLSALSAASGDTTVLGASADYTASIGSYAAEVTQLASAQKSFTTAYTTGTTFGPGDLNFTVGGVAAATISLTSASSSLQDVSDAINSAKVGVTSTVITDSTGKQRMVLTGDKSGASNDFSLTSSLTASGGQDSIAAFDTIATPGLNRTIAQDATMTIDGIEVNSSTNTFSNVAGLTLTAVKLGTSNVTVQNDSSKITTAAQAFVDAYNAVVSLIKSNSSYDVTTKTGQAFSGDATASSVLNSLGSARTTVPSELASANLTTLSALGISIQTSGQLKLDTTVLSSAISTSATDVVQALNAYGKSFSTAATDLLAGNGAVSNRINSLTSSVSRFKDNQAALEVRVSLVEKRYRLQFTALDKLVSSMQTTSSYLTQQLTILQNSS
ncbi:MAG: flagellar filament capping protein FliD [Gammaproteobacteria bacterium]|nr:flagellar filament capping protein FliD [Gammaproteobacteria bacterium]MBU1602879.1 flagellar filament capping protein FliD [Gammaproteobacteria bacterium]MBU2432551.1 flagellar filament capping protein FliD [Gammaproteobacteria bacterium]MBU2448906.1 flagellar filament capping protein FliD [Gammaproteobacteria bacterium]